MLLTLPAPQWLPLGSGESPKTLTFDYKALVRRLTLALAAAALLAAATLYRNYERANHQCAAALLAARKSLHIVFRDANPSIGRVNVTMYGPV